MTREEFATHAHSTEEKTRYDILHDSICMQFKKRHNQTTKVDRYQNNGLPLGRKKGQRLREAEGSCWGVATLNSFICMMAA